MNSVQLDKFEATRTDGRMVAASTRKTRDTADSRQVFLALVPQTNSHIVSIASDPIISILLVRNVELSTIFGRSPNAASITF